VIVEGKEIPPTVVEALEARMRAAPFVCMQLSQIAGDLLKDHGLDVGYRAARVADRLIQTHRKLAHIVFHQREWHWQGGAR
jgi:hypothetical protein